MKHYNSYKYKLIKIDLSYLYHNSYLFNSKAVVFNYRLYAKEHKNYSTNYL